MNTYSKPHVLIKEYSSWYDQNIKNSIFEISIGIRFSDPPFTKNPVIFNIRIWKVPINIYIRIGHISILSNFLSNIILHIDVYVKLWY